MPDVKKIKYISNLQIKHPESGVIYKLKCPDIPEGSCDISLIGTSVEKMDVFYFAAICFRYKDDEATYTPRGEWNFSFVTRASLPPGLLDVIYPLVHFPGESGVFIVFDINYNLDIGQFKIQASQIPLLAGLRSYNYNLELECNMLLGKHLVRVNNYPVFKVNNRPDITYLNHLYSQFWSYNKDKLEAQYFISDDFCHIRAHFINVMLSHLGIDSLKIFSLWGNDDWEGYTDNRGWKFHCAAMIIDSSNRKWVWDPWIGFSSRLLSFREWVLYKEFPIPAGVTITNRAIVNGYNQDAIPCLIFELNLPPDYRNVFQAILGSAIPNPPQPMLRLSGYSRSFFSVIKSPKTSSPVTSVVACSSSGRVFDEQDDIMTSTGLSGIRG